MGGTCNHERMNLERDTDNVSRYQFHIEKLLEYIAGFPEGAIVLLQCFQVSLSLRFNKFYSFSFN